MSASLSVPLAHAETAPPAMVALREAGGKPLRFRGELLAEASSRRPHMALWHEIAVYRCEDGGIAVSLRLRGADGVAESDRARRFPSLDLAADWLAAFEPAADLRAGFDVADPAASGAEIAVKAASLRDRRDDLVRAYRAVVGELLYRIETEL